MNANIFDPPLLREAFEDHEDGEDPASASGRVESERIFPNEVRDFLRSPRRLSEDLATLNRLLRAAARAKGRRAEAQRRLTELAEAVADLMEDKKDMSETLEALELGLREKVYLPRDVLSGVFKDDSLSPHQHFLREELLGLLERGHRKELEVAELRQLVWKEERDALIRLAGAL